MEVGVPEQLLHARFHEWDKPFPERGHVLLIKVKPENLHAGSGKDEPSGRPTCLFHYTEREPVAFDSSSK